jgi:predicted AAA+ superfamily ATPase
MARNYIQRPNYLRQLLAYQDSDLVKIVTGIRRCGKSTLMMLMVEELRRQGISNQNILHMNMESLQHHDLLNYISFYQYVKKNIQSPGKHYLFFDEIQAVAGWEKAIESLRLDHDVDIYITGSNAYFLSSQLSTLLAGRYVEIQMLPLSFQEFLDFHEFEAHISIEERFTRFLQIGGMPVLRQFAFHLPTIYNTLQGIYSTVILQDVLQYNEISDQNLLQKVVAFLSDNIGSINSPHSIGKVLTAEGEIYPPSKGKPGQAIAAKTVNRYISMLENAYVFYGVQRYDVKGKQLLKTLEKHYIVDLGFRNMLLGLRDADRGHVLENVVFLELIRRQYRVNIGKVADLEVDFIAQTPQRKIYIQVAESLLSPDVRERELRPLMSIPDHHEKIVLSMDRSFVQSQNGIRIIHLLDFLLDNNAF